MIGGIGKKFVTRDERDTELRDLLRRIGQAGFAAGGGGGSGGGTGVPSPSARGDMLRATSAPAWERFAIGAINTILKSDGNDPLWTDEPTLKNLTLSDLVVSCPVVTNGAKKLVSQSYGDFLASLEGEDWSMLSRQIVVHDGNVITHDGEVLLCI